MEYFPGLGSTNAYMQYQCSTVGAEVNIKGTEVLGHIHECTRLKWKD